MRDLARIKGVVVVSLDFMEFNAWKLLTLDDLPSSMQNLCELIGLDAVLILLERYHGTRQYIPEKPNPPRSQREGDHWLVEAIGLEKAAIFSYNYGGLSFVFPSCNREVRRINVLRERIEGGKGYRAIAREQGLSESAVREIVRRYSCAVAV